MAKLSAKEIIEKEYGNKRDILTPNVISYGLIADNLAYQIAEGTGLEHQPIYSVSVVKLLPDGSTEKVQELFKLFHSKEEAEDYINRR
jgi:hypothetical protein